MIVKMKHENHTALPEKYRIMSINQITDSFRSPQALEHCLDKDRFPYLRDCLLPTKNRMLGYLMFKDCLRSRTPSSLLPHKNRMLGYLMCKDCLPSLMHSLLPTKKWMLRYWRYKHCLPSLRHTLLRTKINKINLCSWKKKKQEVLEAPRQTITRWRLGKKAVQMTEAVCSLCSANDEMTTGQEGSPDDTSCLLLCAVQMTRWRLLMSDDWTRRHSR